MVMEELLHRFGLRTEAREQELHRRLVGSQAVHADLVKDVHELRQFTIVKLASCVSRLDSLEGAMQNCRTEVAPTLVSLEALVLNLRSLLCMTLGKAIDLPAYSCVKTFARALFH